MFHCTYRPHFVYSLDVSVDTSCCHLSTVVNNGAVNRDVQISVTSLLSVIVDIPLQWELLGCGIFLPLIFEERPYDFP